MWGAGGWRGRGDQQVLMTCSLDGVGGGEGEVEVGLAGADDMRSKSTSRVSK